MSSVLLISPEIERPDGNRWLFGQHDLLCKSAALSTRHRLTRDADDAEIILFSSTGAKPFSGSITETRLFRRHRAKCFVFESADFRVARLPGVYVSLEKSRYDPQWTRGGFYLDLDGENRFEVQPWEDEMPYLFSFTGSCCNGEVRQRIASIRFPRSRLTDTSGQVAPAYTAGDAEAIGRLNRDYADTVRQSRFVLCPRGVGCSSLRIFEVMRMGRAPVILSDEWVPPTGPDWERFSVRVPEADVLKLPGILAPLEPSAREMGILARQEWERWFATPVLFDTLVGWCLDIRRAGRCDQSWYRWRKNLQILRPAHLRGYLRYLKQSWLDSRLRQH